MPSEGQRIQPALLPHSQGGSYLSRPYSASLFFQGKVKEKMHGTYAGDNESSLFRLVEIDNRLLCMKYT